MSKEDTSEPDIEMEGLATIEWPYHFMEARRKLEFSHVEYFSVLSSGDETKLDEDQKRELIRSINDGYSQVCTLRPTAKGFVFPTEAERTNVRRRLTEEGIDEYRMAYQEAVTSRDCLRGIIDTPKYKGVFTYRTPLDLVLYQDGDGPQLALSQEEFAKARAAGGVRDVDPPSPEKLFKLCRKLELELNGPYFEYWSRLGGLKFMTLFRNMSSCRLGEILEMRLRQYVLNVEMALCSGVEMKFLHGRYTGPYPSDGPLEESMKRINSLIEK